MPLPAQPPDVALAHQAVAHRTAARGSRPGQRWRSCWRSSARSTNALGETRAVVIVQGGRLVLERYASGFGPDTPLISWSVAKSITQALVGIAVAKGLVDIDRPMGNPRWAKGDPRAAITWRQWMTMVDGQQFREIGVTSVTEHDSARMLFGQGRLDVAAFAAALPLIHPPGKRWNYNSGGVTLMADALGRRVRPGSHGARRATGAHGRGDDPRAVRPAGHDLGQPAVRRRRHLPGQRPVLRHRPRLCALRAAVSARRRLGGAPAAAGRLGGRGADRDARRAGRPLRRRLVDRTRARRRRRPRVPNRSPRAPRPMSSTPRAFRASSSWSSPPGTSLWCASACSTIAWAGRRYSQWTHRLVALFPAS